MAWKIIDNSVNGIHDVKQFAADSTDDVKNLPDCGMGSTVIILDGSGKVFMKNSSSEWVEI